MSKTPLTEVREALRAVRDLLRTVRAARRDDGEVTPPERAEIREALATVLDEIADVIGADLARDAAARLRRGPLLADGSGVPDPGSLT